MSKEQRLGDLKKTLDNLLPEPIESDARILLWQFIQVFKAKKRHDNTGGFWKKLYYKAIYLPMLADGYIRDLRVNSTAGRLLFPTHYKFGTLTATLKRVKKAQVPADELILAIQICIVLNDWDEDGHC